MTAVEISVAQRDYDCYDVVINYFLILTGSLRSGWGIFFGIKLMIAVAVRKGQAFLALEECVMGSVLGIC